MNAIDLYKPVKPGTKVTIKRGVYRRRRGHVVYQITHPGAAESFLGTCLYALHIGTFDGPYHGVVDFARHEFTAHAHRDYPPEPSPMQWLRPGCHYAPQFGDEFDPIFRDSARKAVTP